METLVLVAVLGMVAVSAITAGMSILFAMQVDKKILTMQENSKSWVDKKEKES